MLIIMYKVIILITILFLSLWEEIVTLLNGVVFIVIYIFLWELEWLAYNWLIFIFKIMILKKYFYSFGINTSIFSLKELHSTINIFLNLYFFLNGFAFFSHSVICFNTFPFFPEKTFFYQKLFSKQYVNIFTLMY